MRALSLPLAALGRSSGGLAGAAQPQSCAGKGWPDARGCGCSELGLLCWRTWLLPPAGAGRRRGGGRQRARHSTAQRVDGRRADGGVGLRHKLQHVATLWQG